MTKSVDTLAREGRKPSGTARKDRIRSRWLALLIVLQVLTLAGILASQYAVLWFGKEIELKTAPIDPRDLFYGEYVTLNYEISRLPVSVWHGRELPERGDRIDVLLRPAADDRKLYEAVRAAPHLSASGNDEVVIRGLVNARSDEQIFVKYGLERYYVPEGDGKGWEQKRASLRVRAAVAPWGRARLESLYQPDPA
jgi:uncharacterized membrane-anchored protein